MAADLDLKKTFLQQGSALYGKMIELAPNDIIRRYLAFRIVVNAMSFEDLVRSRQEPRLREIRNVILAHKQQDDFFKGHQAAEEINDASITRLLKRMDNETQAQSAAFLAELNEANASHNFKVLVPQVFERYQQDSLSGHRVINNFLCITSNAVQEITSGPLPGVFYRYHSSKALYDLSEYLFNNSMEHVPLPGLAMHAKLDMLLHAQNMADSVFKDTRNAHSIDGLLEVMLAEGIGDPSPLQALAADNTFQETYQRVRHVRNKLIGHMDHTASLADLLASLEDLPKMDHINLVNMVDKAVHAAAASHVAIRLRYITGNQTLMDSNILKIVGPAVLPYY